MTKIDRFTLPENVVRLMKEQLENSRKSNLEFGFTLCANNDIIEAKNIVKRFDKEVFIDDKCPSGFKSVGTYHTHPDTISRASAGDLLNTCSHTADCIGGTEDNKIKCYLRKKEIDPIDCTKVFSELTSSELDIRKRSEDILSKGKGDLLIEKKERLSAIKPRNRKIDTELREINKKMKEHYVTLKQIHKDLESHDQILLNLQNRYFDEIEI